MHLESASGSPVCVTWRQPPLRELGESEEPRGSDNSPESRVPGRQRQGFGPCPDLAARTAPRAPLPRPRCGGPGGGGSRSAAARAPVSGALALVRGKRLQYFFYTGLLRASGAPAQGARHALLICIGRRPLGLSVPPSRGCATRGTSTLAAPGFCLWRWARGFGDVCVSGVNPVRLHACLFIHLPDLAPQQGNTSQNPDSQLSSWEAIRSGSGLERLHYTDVPNENPNPRTTAQTVQFGGARVIPSYKLSTPHLLCR